MADYALYLDSCGVHRPDAIEVIKRKYPKFGKAQMSMACNPERNALQLIPAAEDLLVAEFGKGPGLSISPKLTRRKSHENSLKPNRLYVRITDHLRERITEIYERMCFASMQDFIEAALYEFVEKHE